MPIERIEQRPHILVRGPALVERVERLVTMAHQECFIANSLRTDITVRPTVAIVD
ncbi:MAG: hypothetical protein HYX32_01440 [Actinobacteria bacterium]|nr:hypothetical protein [Actinomycetota bacterium]